MTRRARRIAALAGLAIAAAAAVLALSRPAGTFFRKAPDIALGRNVYAKYCAACHGANLQGQPDWQSPRADGSYPAPPHDRTGHTWHHGDAMLLDYIRRGGQATLAGMGVDYVSGMPAFSGTLGDAEIEAVLAYIKSTWPDDIRAYQEDRTRQEAGGP